MEKIAIIILNYNNFKETMKCVDCLLDLELKHHIIIVDNKSTNDSFSVLEEKYNKYENIDIIESDKNGGYSYGNNYGIRYVIEKYTDVNFFCIMNPDVKITYSEIIDNIVRKLKENDDIAAMSAIMIANGYANYDRMCWNLPNNKTIYKHQRLYIKKKERAQNIFVDVDFIARVQVIPGSFFIIKKNELEKIGFLDENVFLYNEENILSWKLLGIGKKVALSLNDYYEHNHVKSKTIYTFKDRLKLNKIGFESRKYLCTKFYPKSCLRKLKVVNLLNIIYLFLVSIYSILKGKGKNEK